MWMPCVYGGFIYTSADSGVTWVVSNFLREDWELVASSSDGVNLVAAIFGGQVYTSGDSGATWTPHNPFASLRRIASSADGTKLVGVVGNGQIYTSTNSGARWTARDSTRNWFSVASSADGTRLVAGVNGGQLYTSADSGVTWKAIESSRAWYSVASSADGTKLAAVDNSGSGSGGQIYTSVPAFALSSIGNSVKISWAFPSTNWMLQQNSDLTTTNWSASGGISNDGTNNFLNLTLPTGNLFFRLWQQ